MTDARASQPAPDWYDRQYDNRARVPVFPQHLARWAADSASARASLPSARLDIAYGARERERLDVFPADPAAVSGGRGAPVLVFIHGGYWRALDKSSHSFVAPPFCAAGACVVVPSYDLCPGSDDAPVTIPSIALQMVQALAWTWRHIGEHGGDPSRITVAGHSAGGHLAAMMLACDWRSVGADLPVTLVRHALSISGLHELESIRRTPHLQAGLHLSEADAVRASPAWMPAPGQGVLNAVVGGDESEEFRRQNRLIRDRWGARRVPVCEELPGLNHFSVVETLAQPGSRLHALARGLLGLGAG